MLDGRDVPESQGEGTKSNSRFECRVCLELATGPVVTPCGHLFCWTCLATWMSKGHNDCPVCKSGVKDDNITPIYTSGDDPADHPKNRPRGRHEAPETPADGSRFQFHVGSGFGFIPFLGFTYVSPSLFAHSDVRRWPSTTSADPGRGEKAQLVQILLVVGYFSHLRNSLRLAPLVICGRILFKTSSSSFFFSL